MFREVTHEVRGEWEGIEDRREFLSVVLWPVLAAISSLWIGASMFEVTTLFFLPPALYFIYSLENGRHLLLFALVMTLVFLPLDYLAHATGLWVVVTEFPRVYGAAALESGWWGVLFVIYVIGFHERFLDDGEFDYFGRKFSAFEAIAFLSMVFILLGIEFPSSFRFPLLYLLFMGPLVVAPVVYGIYEAGITSLGITTVYFTYTNFVHEITALEAGAWNFPLTRTSVAGTVEVLGHALPVEEFLIYMVFTAPAIVCYHHLLARR